MDDNSTKKRESGSEIVVAGVIIVLILVSTNFVSIIIFVVGLFIIRLKSPLCLVLTLGPEASLSLAHLVELGVVLVIDIVLKDFVLLVLKVLILELLNDLLLLGPTLTVLEVVHIKLVFKVVDVGVLLDVGSVESFQLSFETLVLFLELRLYVLDSLQTLVGTLELNTTALDSVLQHRLIATEGLNSLLHLFHLACLRVDNVANALLDILLLRVLVQVATD